MDSDLKLAYVAIEQIISFLPFLFFFLIFLFSSFWLKMIINLPPRSRITNFVPGRKAFNTTDSIACSSLCTAISLQSIAAASGSNAKQS